jgi:hypothetical protein
VEEYGVTAEFTWQTGSESQFLLPSPRKRLNPFGGPLIVAVRPVGWLSAKFELVWGEVAERAMAPLGLCEPTVHCAMAISKLPGQGLDRARGEHAGCVDSQPPVAGCMGRTKDLLDHLTTTPLAESRRINEHLIAVCSDT